MARHHHLKKRESNRAKKNKRPKLPFRLAEMVKLISFSNLPFLHPLSLTMLHENMALQCSLAVQIWPQCRHYIVWKHPPTTLETETDSFSGGTADHERQGASQRKQFAGSQVSKPQSFYWVPETLHSTKPHCDLSDPCSRPDIESACPEDEAHLRLNLSPLFVSVSGVFWQHSCCCCIRVCFSFFLWLICSVL